MIDVGLTLDDLYQALECDIITAVFLPGPTADHIYIDEEGLLKSPEQLAGAFWTDLYPQQPLFGHGLIVGFDPETGNRLDCTLTVEEVSKTVRFLDKEELEYYHEVLNNIPPTIITF